MVLLAESIKLTLFPAIMAFAALSDLFTMSITNRVSIILVAGFGLLAALTQMGASDLLSHVGAAAAVLAAVFVFFAFGWIGGGDAKLMAASALWVGLRGLAPFALYTGLAGGALALLLVLMRSAWLRPLAAAGPAWTRRLATPGEAAPYGVAIAIGALAAFAGNPLA